MSKLKHLIISLRPWQWIKNSFVIAPLLFSKNMMDGSIVARVGFAFILFCLFSSSIYLLNDIFDLKNDRHHPKKSKRPLADGLISVKTSLWVSMILLLVAVVGSGFLDERFLLVGSIYWLINFAYSAGMKRVVIIDVVCIATGFVLRVLAGGIAVMVPSSPWILVTTIFLALFLGFSKRRGEIEISSETRKHETRSVLKYYNIQLLDQFLIICATASMVLYCLFTLSDYALTRFGTENLVFTIPFVIYGIFRYLHLTHFTGAYENPTMVLLTDKAMLIDIVLWVACVVLIIY